MNKKIIKKNNQVKLGWDVGCCGVIKCWQCKEIIYCAELNAETCSRCRKNICDNCIEFSKHSEKCKEKKLWMKEQLTDEELKEGKKKVEEARRIKWSKNLENYNQGKMTYEGFKDEIVFDLKKIRDEGKINSTEVELIAKELLDNGWSEKLKPGNDIHVVKEKYFPQSTFLESKEERTCCAWRKYFITDIFPFDLNDFIETRKMLHNSVGEKPSISFYSAWLQLVDKSECWDCEDVFFELKEWGGDNWWKTAKKNIKQCQKEK